MFGIGKKTFIENDYPGYVPSISYSFMQGRSRIIVGRFTYGFKTMQVKEWGEGASLEIGSFCSLASGIVFMLGGNHRTDWISTFPFGHIFREDLCGEGIVGHPKTNGNICIGHDVWIGQNTTIMSGIKVGNGAVIAANSTVVKDVGPYEVWGGNPAKMLRRRFDNEIIQELCALRWWDFSIETIRQVAPLLSQSPTLLLLHEINRLNSEGMGNNSGGAIS